MRFRWTALASALLLTYAYPLAVRSQNAAAAVTVSVDAAAGRHAISPLIYGVHFGDRVALADLNATVNRYGGNSSGRYNWVQNIDNRGGDYFFESIPYATPVTGGEHMDDFISESRAGLAEPFLTMPMVGSVAITNGNRDTLWSFSVNDCGPQTASDGDAGNGCVAGPTTYPCAAGVRLLPPRPNGCDPVNAASTPADENFQQGWVQHVKDMWGAASAGGLKFWGMDNEPSIWHTAYWDVHPLPADDQETRAKMIAYGAMIKAVDPSVQVLGPEEWGWDGFFYSGHDQQQSVGGGCDLFFLPNDCRDHALHGDYVPYLLAQMKAYADAHGNLRVLDWLSLHYYPQGGEFSDDVSAATQALRNRSTRELWDPNYTSESYIADKVQLIPRMRSWVDTYYPGTKIALTEYNWGAEDHINGATAEADLLGIFGREGLDMAIRWVVPATGTRVYNAFKMYRNYDGADSGFGDTSVSASVPDPDTLSAFAAQRTASGELTVMVVNKGAASTDATVNLANFGAGASAQVWQLTSANSIDHLSDVAVAGNSFTKTLPAQSITLFVVPSGNVALPTLQIDDVSVPEGNAGTASAVFHVTLSAASAHTVTVNYATVDGTATAGSDYTAAAGTLTFAPGAVSRTVTVPVRGDTVPEDNETFFVNLTSPVNATIADAQGIGTIIDDDPPPTISIANCTVVEGDSGTTPCAFHVSLSAPSTRTITVHFATADGTAQAGTDYLAASGTLTFTPGVSVQDAVVSVIGDTAVEPNETYVVNLDTPTNATIADNQAIGTITDNDDLEFFTLSPCRVLDTGNPPGPSGGPAMSANTTRIFPAAGVCGIPATAKSIAINVTTAAQTDFGHLRVYPADAALPNASTINFVAGQNRGNNAIVSLGTAGQISISCFMPVGSSGTTRVIVDVLGYFE